MGGSVSKYANKIMCQSDYQETVIEILDQDGGVVYEAFPESGTNDLAYALEYVDRYGAGGFFYPPNTYHTHTLKHWESLSDEEIAAVEAEPEPISFDDGVELLGLVQKYLSENISCQFI